MYLFACMTIYFMHQITSIALLKILRQHDFFLACQLTWSGGGSPAIEWPGAGYRTRHCRSTKLGTYMLHILLYYYGKH
jgi:hypothetical protein